MRILGFLLCGLVAASCNPKTPFRTNLEVDGTSWDVGYGRWAAEQNALVGTGGWIRTHDDMQDGTIDLDYEIVSSPFDREVSIGFHNWFATSDIEKGSGYALSFHPEKTFIVRAGSNGVWSAIGPSKGNQLQPSPLFKSGINHLKFTMAGSSYTIELNNQVLAAFNDPAHPRGALALWVESTASRVKFSNVRIAKK